jgi:hypothetical protein
MTATWIILGILGVFALISVLADACARKGCN